MSELDQGTIMTVVSLEDWPRGYCEMLRSKFDGGSIALYQDRRSRLRVDLSSDPNGHVVDRVYSCPLRLEGNAPLIILVRWKNCRIDDIRINGATAFSRKPGEASGSLEVGKHAVEANTANVQRRDFSAESAVARQARVDALAARTPKTGRRSGGRTYAFKSLGDEVDQMRDLLALIEQGKRHNILGLMSRVRLLLINNPLGLLQECAAWQNAPLTMYTSTHVGTMPPIPITYRIIFDGSPVATNHLKDPVDLDVWLALKTLTIKGVDFTALEVLKHIGNTVASHRDPDITNVIDSLLDNTTNLKTAKTSLDLFSVVLAKTVMSLAERLLDQERRSPSQVVV